jgi:hypothetical protein
LGAVAVLIPSRAANIEGAEAVTSSLGGKGCREARLSRSKQIEKKCGVKQKAKPRDMIYALRKPPVPDVAPNALPEYGKNSQKKAEMARDYYENLQSR